MFAFPQCSECGLTSSPLLPPSLSLSLSHIYTHNSVQSTIQGYGSSVTRNGCCQLHRVWCSWQPDEDLPAPCRGRQSTQTPLLFFLRSRGRLGTGGRMLTVGAHKVENAVPERQDVPHPSLAAPPQLRETCVLQSLGRREENLQERRTFSWHWKGVLDHLHKRNPSLCVLFRYL